jgi:hypothetical protein
LNYAADEANDSPLVGFTHEQPYVITFVRLDVGQSSAALAPGGDFSTFSFLPSGLLTGWNDSFDPSGGFSGSIPSRMPPGSRWGPTRA